MINNKNIKELLQKNVKGSLFDTLLEYSTIMEAKLRDYAKNAEQSFNTHRNEFPAFWDDEVKAMQLFFWQLLFDRRNPFTGELTEFEEFFSYYLLPVELAQNTLKKYDCQFKKLFPIPNSGKIDSFSFKKILNVYEKGDIKEISKITSILREIVKDVINGKAPKYWKKQDNKRTFELNSERDKGARKLILTFLMTEI